MPDTPDFEMRLVQKAINKIANYQDWQTLVEKEPKLIIKAMQLTEYANIVLRNRYAYFITPDLPIQNHERLAFELDGDEIDISKHDDYIDTKAELIDGDILKITTLPIVYRIKNHVRNYIYSMITSAIEQMLNESETWPEYRSETTEIVFVRYSPIPSMCDPDHVEMSTTINAMKDILLHDDSAMYVSFHSLGVVSERNYTEIYLMTTSKYASWYSEFMSERRNLMQPHLPNKPSIKVWSENEYEPVEALNIKKLKRNKESI